VALLVPPIPPVLGMFPNLPLAAGVQGIRLSLPCERGAARRAGTIYILSVILYQRLLSFAHCTGQNQSLAAQDKAV